MLPARVIRHKRDGGRLDEADVRAFIAGVTDGSIPDYQVAAMLMAIYFRGLDDDELAAWADAMLRSGDVLDLCDGVDLLVHDAQHTAAEYEIKRTWGHCTIEYAVHVAKEAGARQLALFHHCPSHGDDRLDTILRDAREFSARINGPEVFAAADGLRHELGPAR